MIQLCIIGNSHLGAPKLAMPEFLAPYSEQVDVTFWGAAGTYFPKIRLHRNTLISPTPDYSKRVSGGRARNLDLSKFDAIVFYGCHVDISSIARRIVKDVFGRSGLSSQFSDEAVRDIVLQWWQRLSIRTIMADTSTRELVAQRFLYAHPYISENSDVFQDITIAQSVVATIQKTLATLASEVNVEFRPQPVNTVAGGAYTYNKYSVGSVKLATEGELHPEDDHVHMNIEYGREILADLFSALPIERKNLITAHRLTTSQF